MDQHSFAGRPILALVLSLALSGCEIFVPQQVEFYDEDCRILARKLTLRSVGTGAVSISCHNEGCLIPLIPTAASAIISGSVVVVGNVIYWLEKQGRCQRREPQALAP